MPSSTPPSDADELRETIKVSLSELDIAGYLQEEVSYMLDHLNIYKLTNIYNNQDSFFSYLCQLDQENSKLMKQLVQ